MSRLFSVLIGLAVLVFAAAYFGSAFLAADDLRKAAETGDRATLERRVDFDAVRESLKGQLRDRVSSAAARRGGGLAGALGSLVAPLAVDRTVDAVVTPEVVSTVIREARAPRTLDPGLGERPTPGVRGEQPELKTRFGYRSLDRFHVAIARVDDPDRPVGLEMERRGLFDWKLVAIILPE